MVHQFLNIFFSFPKRRDRDVQKVQPVIQIRTELPLFDLFFHIDVRGGDYPYIHRMHAGASNPPDLFFLQYPQKLRLQCDRDLPDLIQKNRSFMCKFKQTGLASFGRSGKSARFIAEQFAFQQILRKRRAVERHKGLMASFARLMNAVRKQFFSCTCLSDNEYIGIDPAVTFCHPDILTDRRTLPQNILKGIFCSQPLLRQPSADPALFLNDPVRIFDKDQRACPRFHLTQRLILHIIFFIMKAYDPVFSGTVFQKLLPLPGRPHRGQGLSDQLPHR